MNATKLIAWGLSVLLLDGCASTASSERVTPQEDAAIANMNLAAGYLKQGRLDVAIERLQRALKENPRLAEAHTTIALAYDQLGSLEDAEEHYKRATQLEPNNAASANAYAVFLCNRENRWVAAEPYFKRAAENATYATPEVPYTNAGLCARSAGKLDKAEENFRAALTRNPTYPDALTGMIELSYDQKKYLQARAFMQRYLDVQQPNAPMLLICFNVEQELDNKPGAERCADQLRTRFPQSPEVAQLQQALQSNGR
jgi:type IV pilus assembly protein PilF